MDKELEELLKNWEWNKETIEAMRRHPDIQLLKQRREQLYEAIKDMTPKERVAYFNSLPKYNP